LVVDSISLWSFVQNLIKPVLAKVLTNRLLMINLEIMKEDDRVRFLW
jgi:hypothetical protein